MNRPGTEKRRAYYRKWYASHREKVLAKTKAYNSSQKGSISARRKSHYIANRDHICASRRARYAANPERHAAYNKSWIVAHKEEIRAYQLRYNFGLSLGEYDAILEKQGGSCAICKRTDWPGKGHKPHVDHDHLSGHVRGLLCSPCNVALGMLRDDPGIAQSLVDYLHRFNGNAGEART